MVELRHPRKHEYRWIHFYLNVLLLITSMVGTVHYLLTFDTKNIRSLIILLRTLFRTNFSK